MKKGLNILFIFMLVFQSMFTSMACSNTIAAEGSKKEVDTEVTVGGESYGDYTLSGDNPFKIDFPEDYTTDKEIIITYKTAFDADKVPNNKPTNKAAITWTPEGENDSITKEVEAETELNWETGEYSWKNGSYNPATKEITW